MANIVRWFEDFPNRALELMRQVEPIAAARDRIGSLSLLVAPALIIAPYERLQTYAGRKNPQADYLRFTGAHHQFDRLMRSPFGQASFWTEDTLPTTSEWRCSQVVRGIAAPDAWQTVDGLYPWEPAFWSDSILRWETRRVWKSLRDSLAHWNVATSDRECRNFDENGVMERLLLYRSDRDKGPWDIVGVSPAAFFVFLTSWAQFLSQGLAREILIASAAGVERE